MLLGQLDTLCRRVPQIDSLPALEVTCPAPPPSCKRRRSERIKEAAAPECDPTTVEGDESPGAAPAR